MDEERYDIEAKCLHNTREVRLGGGGAGPGPSFCRVRGWGTQQSTLGP